MKKTVFVSSFVLGHSIVLAAISAIGIYVFNYYENAFRKGISFQISLWFVLLSAFPVFIGFGLGVRMSNWVSKYSIGIVAGGLFAGFVMGVSEILNYLTKNTGARQVVLFTIWFAGSMLIPLVLAKFSSSIQK